MSGNLNQTEPAVSGWFHARIVTQRRNTNADLIKRLEYGQARGEFGGLAIDRDAQTGSPPVDPRRWNARARAVPSTKLAISALNIRLNSAWECFRRFAHFPFASWLERLDSASLIEVKDCIELI